MSKANVLAAVNLDEDIQDTSLRPKMLSDFTGQGDVCDNLKVFIQAAKGRNEAMDHVLFFGPPGLGKTTLAQIIAHELGVGFRSTAGPMLSKAGDLAAILTNLQPHDVLFIDEIHRLSPTIEEVLYPAMEDYKLDLIIGEGPSARTVQIELPPFTLVAATTRTGLLSAPLRDRFGIPLRLNFYPPKELSVIIARNARLMHMEMTGDGIQEIAERSRGTPRIAGRLLRRIRDYGAVAGGGAIDQKLVRESLDRLGVDQFGLDQQDRRYLEQIAYGYKGGPVGIETLAAGLFEQRDTIEEVIEPYLIQQSLIARTPRGRVLSPQGYQYLGLTPPAQAPHVQELDL